MARTVAQIQADIIAYKNAQTALDVLDSDSKRAIWLLWTYITAVAIAVLEQLIDAYIVIIEKIVARSAASSQAWIQNKMFEFQYDATDPQVVQLINTVPQYPTVDATKRIITGCSVTTDISNVVNIKVAKGSPFQALSNPEKAAAQDYITTIGTAGINYVIKSKDADKIFIEADIYYRGQYSAVIHQLVIDGINNYLQQLGVTKFDGAILMSDLEGIIRNVEGVTDVVINNVKARQNTTPLANATPLITNTAVISRLYQPEAGYIVGETTAGNTFADTLTFIAQ